MTEMKGWKPIESALKDGSKVRVGHEMCPSSMREDGIFRITGIYVEGRWMLSSFFACTDRSLRTIPTHWFPEGGQ